MATPVRGMSTRALQAEQTRPTDHQVAALLKDHHRFLDAHLRSTLEAYRKRYLAPVAEAGDLKPEVRKTLAASSTSAFGRADHDLCPPPHEPAPGCSQTTVDQPWFDFASPLAETPVPGGLSTYQRGNLDGRLEVASSVGSFEPLSPTRIYPGTASGSMAQFNAARATGGRLLPIPQSIEYTLLEVGACFALEQVEGRSPAGWDNFIFLLPGAADTGLIGGLCIAWCNVMLTLHTADGTVSAIGQMASSSATYASTPPIPIAGAMHLFVSAQAVLAPNTSAVCLLFDAESFAWGEENPGGEQAFAEIGVHDPPASESILAFGAALATGAIRVQTLTTTACPIPVLSGLQGRAVTGRTGRGRMG